MKNKLAKISILLLYTLLIFQSYVIPLIIGAIEYNYNIFSYRFLFRVFCPFIFIPWRFVGTMLPTFASEIFEAISNEAVGDHIEALIFFTIIWAFNFLLVYRWFKRQSPLTAWGVAFLGSCYAFMLFPASIVFGDGRKDGFGGIALVMVNGFYLFLCTADIYQKEFWPRNKFANRIRRWLAYPCINPANCHEALAKWDSNVSKRADWRDEARKI